MSSPLYQAVNAGPTDGSDISIDPSLTRGDSFKGAKEEIFATDGFDIDSDTSLDDHMYKKFSTTDGLVFVGLSAVSLGLGNSLDSMSTLSMFHPFLLVCGLEVCADKIGIFYTLVVISFTQAAGTTFGFASLFGMTS